MSVSEQQVRLFKGGRVTLLEQWLDQQRVRSGPFVAARDLTIANGASVALVDSTLLAGTIAVFAPGVAAFDANKPSANGGVVATALAGAVGTAVTLATTTARGATINLVSLRDTTTNEALKDGTGREVKGLVHCASTVTDGDAIGAAAAENLQVSLVVEDAGGAFVTYVATAAFTVNFTVNYLDAKRWEQNLAMAMAGTHSEHTDAGSLTVRRLLLTATADYAANEVITLATGVGAGTGTATVDADYADAIDLGANAAAMKANKGLTVYRNGVAQTKGVEFVYDSSTTGHFTAPIRNGEVYELVEFATA